MYLTRFTCLSSCSHHHAAQASSKPAGKKIDAASFFGTKTQTKVAQSTKSTESKATEAASAKGAPPPKLSPSKPADGKKKLKRKTDDDDDDDDDNGASAMDVDEPSATAARTVQAATKTEPKKAEQKKEDTKATHKDAKDEKKEKKSDKDEKKAEMDASKASTDDSKAKKESKATTKKHKGSDDSGDGDAKASDADGGSPKKRKKAQADITVAPESPKKSISGVLISFTSPSLCFMSITCALSSLLIILVLSALFACVCSYVSLFAVYVCVPHVHSCCRSQPQCVVRVKR